MIKTLALIPNALFQVYPKGDISVMLLLRAEIWSTKFKLKIPENFQAEV